MVNIDLGALIVDAIKQEYDFFKHLTTLDTGAIVILATFFSKSFANTSANWLIILCVIALIVSLVACVLGMLFIGQFMISLTTPKHNEEANRISGRTRSILSISIIGFVTGVVSLAIFVMANVKV